MARCHACWFLFRQVAVKQYAKIKFGCQEIRGHENVKNMALVRHATKLKIDFKKNNYHGELAFVLLPHLHLIQRKTSNT